MENKLSNRKELAKNTFFAGLTSLADVFLLLLLVVAGRFLGVDKYGLFSYSLALASILVYLTNLGIDSIAIRRIAIDNKSSDTIVSQTLIWKTIVSIFLLSIFILAIYFLIEDNDTVILISVLAIASILRSFNMTFRSYIQGFEDFFTETILVTGERFFLFTFGLISLYLYSDALALAWVFLIVRICSAIAYVFIINSRLVTFNFKPDVNYIKSFQLEALPLGISTLIYGLYIYIDTILLGLYTTNHEVGLFSSAHKIYEGILVFAIVITSAFYPRLSSTYNKNRASFSDLSLRVIKYVLIISVFFIIYGLSFSEETIQLLFGSEFSESKTILTTLIISSSTYILVISFYMFFRSSGNQRLVLYMNLVGILTKIAFNLLLIPEYGAQGSAVAALISSTTILLGSILLMFKLDLIKQPPYSIYLNILLSGICVFSLIYMLPDHMKLIALITSFLSYPVFLFILKCFDRYEIELIHEILSFKKQRH